MREGSDTSLVTALLQGLSKSALPWASDLLWWWSQQCFLEALSMKFKQVLTCSLVSYVVQTS